MLTTELEALHGSPVIQRWLYVELRKYMDIATGVVGIKRGISWQSLREALEVEGKPGIKHAKPSKDQVRGAADALVRNGLLKSRSTKERLIFECLLAHTDKSVQKKVTIKPPSQVTTFEGNKHAATVGKVTTPKKAKAPTPPSIRDISMTTSSSSQPVADSTGADDDDNLKLIYPKNLSTRQQAAIKKALSGFDATNAQLMLDELAGQMVAKTISNPVGYMQTIAKSAKEGNFTPQRAIAVQEGRERQEAIDRQVEAGKKAILQEKQAKTAGAGKVIPKRSFKEALQQSKRGQV